jgi:hypothetical protein
MSDEPTQSEESPSDAGPREAEWERRRRIAAVFGDVLPDTTSDEQDTEVREQGDADDARDSWLRRQVPPHHG